MSLSPRQRCFYTVNETSHEDCYKRAESYSSIIGVYDNPETAYQVATMMQFNSMVELGNPMFERKYGDGKISLRQVLQCISEQKTWEDAWLVWKNLNNPEGEFTMQASGDYYTVSKERINSEPPKDQPISEWSTNAALLIDEED